MRDDLAFRPAVELAALLRARELTSRELLEQYLARIERVNPKLNAVVTLDAERARRAADAADAALGRGQLTGPLHGLPMTIKDSLETAGLRTACGAPTLAGHIPAADAVAVARLRAAGAIVFGKTNTPTFAMDVQTYNPVFGVTNNPWDVARTPGGSSGGAAAAVAAGLTAFEFGSDIGGSIRTPSGFCGVYGHKPTWGIVPLRGHIPGPPGTLAETDIGVVGPIARDARDLQLALDVVAGPDAAAAAGWRLALPPPRHAALRDYRVAAWLDDATHPVDSAVRARLEAVVAALRQAGVKVDERARPDVPVDEAFRDYRRLLFPVTTAGMPDEQFGALCAMAATDDRSDTAEFARAAAIRHHDWLATHERRERQRVAWARFFEQHDVLICPVTPVPAIPHMHENDIMSRTITVNGVTRPYLDLILWAGLIGMVHLPSTAAPAGRTPEGLPVGVQIVGPYLEDRTTIDFARQLAQVTEGFVRPPLG